MNFAVVAIFMIFCTEYSFGLLKFLTCGVEFQNRFEGCLSKCTAKSKCTDENSLCSRLVKPVDEYCDMLKPHTCPKFITCMSHCIVDELSSSDLTCNVIELFNALFDLVKDKADKGLFSLQRLQTIGKQLASGEISQDSVIEMLMEDSFPSSGDSKKTDAKPNPGQCSNKQESQSEGTCSAP